MTALQLRMGNCADVIFASQAGLLSWRSCYPFAVLGAPFSVLGGATDLSPTLYQPTVGVLLLVVSVQMIRSASSAARRDSKAPASPPFLASLLAGGGIGFVSGITGVGGGIFLAPIVLAFGWAETRQTAAISAMFNLLNSAAAFSGPQCRRCPRRCLGGCWPPDSVACSARGWELGISDAGRKPHHLFEPAAQGLSALGDFPDHIHKPSLGGQGPGAASSISTTV